MSDSAVYPYYRTFFRPFFSAGQVIPDRKHQLFFGKFSICQNLINNIGFGICQLVKDIRSFHFYPFIKLVSQLSHTICSMNRNQQHIPFKEKGYQIEDDATIYTRTGGFHGQRQKFKF